MLILDEPTEGIQPNVVAEIEETIISLARDGLSVLLVEQHVGFALREAKDYLVLAAGNVVRSGSGGQSAEEEVRDAMAI